MPSLLRKPWIGLLVLASCVSACHADGDPAPAGPASSTEIPASASATPADAPLVSPLERGFVMDIQQPILALEGGYAWDSGHLAPGGVVFHDGEFHMLYNAFLSLDAETKVGYAVSPDGITWTRQSEQPVFEVKDIPWGEFNKNFRVASLMAEGDTWVMYFSGSNQSSYVLGAIGRATATSPAGPWTVDAQPLLMPGGAGEWDTLAIGNAEVLRTGDGYVMYYSSAGGGVGLAASADGVHWAKHNDPSTVEPRLSNSDPVLSTFGLDDLAVGFTGEYWIMVIGGKVSGLAYATSVDGIRWTQLAEPFVSLSDVGMFSRYLALIRHEGRAFLYFEAGVNNTRTYYAAWDEPDRR